MKLDARLISMFVILVICASSSAMTAEVICRGGNTASLIVVFAMDTDRVFISNVKGMERANGGGQIDVEKYNCSQSGLDPLWICEEFGAPKGSEFSFILNELEPSASVIAPLNGDKLSDEVLVCTRSH